ncbi:Argininosuccinate synthase, partial [Colletotrichum sp. SAR11_239]
GSSDLDLGRQARQDIVENRYIGLKSLGCYAMTILRLAHISIEGLSQVRLRLYKGGVYVLGRSPDEKLYSKEDASMDSLTRFHPLDTTGFITIQAIRLKKYGTQMAEADAKF